MIAGGIRAISPMYFFIMTINMIACEVNFPRQEKADYIINYLIEEPSNVLLK